MAANDEYKLGAFGDVAFQVSSDRVLTFDKYKRTTKHNFAEHKVHNRQPVLESVGGELEEISMTILLHTSLGVDPREESEMLRTMCKNAEPNDLIIGTEAINGTRFVITEISEDSTVWSPLGILMESKLTIKLKEYTEHGD